MGTLGLCALLVGRGNSAAAVENSGGGPQNLKQSCHVIQQDCPESVPVHTQRDEKQGLLQVLIHPRSQPHHAQWPEAGSSWCPLMEQRVSQVCSVHTVDSPSALEGSSGDVTSVKQASRGRARTAGGTSTRFRGQTKRAGALVVPRAGAVLEGTALLMEMMQAFARGRRGCSRTILSGFDATEFVHVQGGQGDEYCVHFATSRIRRGLGCWVQPPGHLAPARCSLSRLGEGRAGPACSTQCRAGGSAVLATSSGPCFAPWGPRWLSPLYPSRGVQGRKTMGVRGLHSHRPCEAGEAWRVSGRSSWPQEWAEAVPVLPVLCPWARTRWGWAVPWTPCRKAQTAASWSLRSSWSSEPLRS